MPSFQHLIAPAQPSPADIPVRRWICIPYDRYTDRSGTVFGFSASSGTFFGPGFVSLDR